MTMISAFIITHNEAAKIAACLDSLRWVEEVVVVDDNSSDDTVAICRRYPNVRLFQHPFASFRDQKSYAMSLTSNDWVLEIDADERVSPEMRESITDLTSADFAACSSFEFKRLTNFWGKWIRHASFYPDYKARLYNKQNGAWSEANVHERFIARGGKRRLTGDIIHDQDLDLLTYLQRTARYANLSAIDLHAREKRARWHQLTIRPLYTFVYRYFFRLGFLEGVRGLVIAVMGAVGTFVKYAKLRELERGYVTARDAREVR